MTLGKLCGAVPSLAGADELRAYAAGFGVGVEIVGEYGLAAVGQALQRFFYNLGHAGKAEVSLAEGEVGHLVGGVEHAGASPPSRAAS